LVAHGASNLVVRTSHYAHTQAQVLGGNVMNFIKTYSLYIADVIVTCVSTMLFSLWLPVEAFAEVPFSIRVKAQVFTPF
jgi:hypothetical protein